MVREMLRFPAQKRTIRKKAHKWRGPMCKLNSHGRGYPLNYSIWVPPSPQPTKSRLQTTAVGLPAPYEPQGNREYRRTRLLSGVLSQWRPAGVQWNKNNGTKNHSTDINDRPSFPSYLTGCSAATTPVPENWKLRRVIPREGYTTLLQTLQKSVTWVTCCTTAS